MGLPHSPNSTPGTALAHYAPPATRLAPQERYGFWYPRWSFAGACLVTVSTVMAMVVPRIVDRRTSCTLGAICAIDQWPVGEQVATVCGVFLAGWIAAFLWGLGLQVTDLVNGPSGRLNRWLWHLSHFERISALIIGTTIVALLGTLVSAIFHRLTPQLLTLSLIMAFVTVRVIFWWLALDARPKKTLPPLPAAPPPPLLTEPLVAVPSDFSPPDPPTDAFSDPLPGVASSGSAPAQAFPDPLPGAASPYPFSSDPLPDGVPIESTTASHDPLPDWANM